MVHFRSEFLFPARVLRLGISTTNIAGDGARSFPELFQRPDKIDNLEAAAFPVRHGFFWTNTIKVDGNVEICPTEARGKVFEFPSPIVTQNCAATLSIFHGPIIRPRMHFKNPCPFSATVAEDLVRPPAFKIPAAPHAHQLHVRKFERAIHPTSAAPFRRANVPVGMIVERDHDNAFSERTQAQRT